MDGRLVAVVNVDYGIRGGACDGVYSRPVGGRGHGHTNDSRVKVCAKKKSVRDSGTLSFQAVWLQDY